MQLIMFLRAEQQKQTMGAKKCQFWKTMVAAIVVAVVVAVVVVASMQNTELFNDGRKRIARKNLGTLLWATEIIAAKPRQGS